MKVKHFFFLILVISLTMLAACGQAEDSAEPQEEEEVIPVVYEDNETINAFINNYNIANPDDVIEPDMVEKDEHHGSVHDDQVNITKEEGAEVNLNDTYPFRVYIQGYQSNLENDEYKQIVFKYAKGFDPSLTDEKLEDYWSQTMDDLTYNVEFDEFELRLSLLNGKIEYLTMDGSVKKKAY